jgi:hypothetical protein
MHSLGGNSYTVMVACVSPADAAYEENLSTLEYAARAKRITNQVYVNEDPKSRLIRQLKAENAFLKEQLAQASGGGPQRAWHPVPPPPQLLSVVDTVRGRHSAGEEPSPVGDDNDGSAASRVLVMDAAASRQASQAVQEQAVSVSAQAAAAVHAAETMLLRSDGGAPPEQVRVIGQKLVESVKYIKDLLALNDDLRKNFSRVDAEKESLVGENERLSMEVTDTSERLEFYESVLLMDDEAAGSMHTVSNASMAEVRFLFRISDVRGLNVLERERTWWVCKGGGHVPAPTSKPSTADATMMPFYLNTNTKPCYG